MKIYEILSFNAELLEKLQKVGINTNDYKSYQIYKEYLKLRNEGYKVIYIVATLSKRFNVCERKIYMIIKKMERDCNVCAV